MLTPRPPYPPNRGDTVRSWAELEHLARRHDVWLACLSDGRPTPTQLAKLRNICRDLAVTPRSRLTSLRQGTLSLLHGRSLTEGFFADASLTRTVRAWAEAVRFDAVLAFSSAMAPLAELVEARRVLDMNDVDSHKWRVYADRSRPPLRWLYALEARRLAAAEQRWVRSHEVTLLVNERERRKLLARAKPRHAEVVRMPVEIANTDQPGSSGERPPLPTEPIVGSVGSMFYPPNVRAIEWFGRNVWPLVKKKMPTARWWIVGNRPARQVRRWGRRQDVRVTGFVPSTRPYLDAFRVFINPVDGDIGVQTKLLCAMAAGKPAVVTPEAAAGIAYDGEPPFLIAREPDKFADAVLRLLQDDALATRLGERALRVIEDYYQPHEELRRIEQALSGQPCEARACGERDRRAAPVGAAAEVLT
ncbi:MAG: glycosyltransferase family 4 protein [Planctomycetes bacterium]|nr:glycosyltransferase family 4 protein [Planctomycetota bacterium]